MTSQTFAISSGRTALNPSSDTFALVGRGLLAAIFIFFGAGKAVDPSGTISYIASAGLPFPSLAYAGAVAVELGGGLALLAGYRTSIVAAVLALFSIVTALTFHADLADQNQLIHFFKNFAMAGGLAQIAAFGAGRFSVDARRS